VALGLALAGLMAILHGVAPAQAYAALLEAGFGCRAPGSCGLITTLQFTTPLLPGLFGFSRIRAAAQLAPMATGSKLNAGLLLALAVAALGGFHPLGIGLGSALLAGLRVGALTGLQLRIPHDRRPPSPRHVRSGRGRSFLGSQEGLLLVDSRLAAIQPEPFFEHLDLATGALPRHREPPG
jgi:hypothetical protein